MNRIIKSGCHTELVEVSGQSVIPAQLIVIPSKDGILKPSHPERSEGSMHLSKRGFVGLM